LTLGELDGLFRERSAEDHDVGRDLKTEFLQLWDGIRNHAQGRGSSSILVIGATNRPHEVDPAFLRRMPRRVYVGLPDGDSRISILEKMLNDVPLDKSFDLGLVASKTAGYSPSDIREVLQVAALYPLREARAEAMSLSQKKKHADGEKDTNTLQIPPLRRLCTNDVLKALEVAKPTHFSPQYQNELTEFVRSSRGSHAPSLLQAQIRDCEEKNEKAPGKDTDDIFFSDYEDESDTYSYDEDASDSDSI